MRESTKRLNQLIGLMKSGNELYQQAKQRIDDRELQAIFSENLREREQIIDKLRSLSDEATTDGTSSPEATYRINRADLLAALKDNQAAVYAQQLANLEAETERVFIALSGSGLDAETQKRLQHLKFDFDRVRERIAAARNLAWNRESPTTLSTRISR